MTIFVIPLVIFAIWLIWFSITFFYNTIIIPALSLPESYNISIDKWIIIAIVLIIIYYLFFTKKIEWEKFKIHRKINEE